MNTSPAELGHAVKRLQVSNHRAATSALRDLDITLVQWDALRHLDAHPGASLHDLAVLTFQTDQAFGTLAARLEARGLIRRVSGVGRAIRPELTKEGERLFTAGREVTQRVMAQRFAPLNAAELDVLAGLLRRLLTEGRLGEHDNSAYEASAV